MLGQPLNNSLLSPAAAPTSNSFDPLGGGSSILDLPPAAPAPAASIPSITAFEKSGLKIVFQLARPDPTTISIDMSASNANPSPLEEFVFQAAVPKVRACAANKLKAFVRVSTGVW